jgi:hypothetical protein
MVDEFTHPFDDWFADSAKDLTGEQFLLKPHVTDEDELVEPANIKRKDLEDSDLKGPEDEAPKTYGLSDME